MKREPRAGDRGDIGCLYKAERRLMSLKLKLAPRALLSFFCFSSLIRTHLPKFSTLSVFLKMPESFVPVPAGSDFPLENLPYAVFSTQNNVSNKINNNIITSVAF